MLLALLLDPHWNTFESSVSLLFFIGFVVPLVLWLVLRVTGVLKSEDEQEESAAEAEVPVKPADRQLSLDEAPDA